MTQRKLTKYRRRNPLDIATPWEVAWERVSPIFEAAREFVAPPCFVYFIGEEDGPIKIGSANNPILRLRTLQTGNPRALRIEYVLLGDSYLERSLHRFWQQYKISTQRWLHMERVAAVHATEWFEKDIREEVGLIVKEAVRRQLKLVATTQDVEDLNQVARQAHIERMQRAKKTSHVIQMVAWGHRGI